MSGDRKHLFKHIGEAIRRKRKELGLTQEELAQRLGVTWEMVSRYERGESITITRLMQLIEVLGLDIDEVFVKPKVSVLYERDVYDLLQPSTRMLINIRSFPSSLKDFEEVIKNIGLSLKDAEFDLLMPVSKKNIRLGSDLEWRKAYAIVTPVKKGQFRKTGRLPALVLVCNQKSCVILTGEEFSKFYADTYKMVGVVKKLIVDFE